MNSLSPIAAAQTVATTARGKSAQSAGHLAKAAVAEARAAGAELPKNAQGMAASQIAHGADPGSVFAGIIAAQMQVEPVETSADQAAAAYDAATDATATDGETEPTTGETAPVAGDTEVGASDDEVALTLLEQAAEDSEAM